MERNVPKIKEITSRHYEVPFGDADDKELISRTELYFDESGRKIREEEYDAGDELVSAWILYPLKRMSESIRDVHGTPNTESETFFDSQDRITEKREYRTGAGQTLVWTYFYDKTGRRTEKICRDSRGKEKERAKYTHDRRGNCVEKTVFFPEALLNYRIAFLYDGKGNLLERTHYDAQGKLSERIRYTYDKYGECARKEFYDLNDTLYLIEECLLEYDGQGSWVRMESYRQGREEIADFAYQDRMEEKELAGITVREIVYY